MEGEDTGMALIPEGVKAELPPWKAAWWRKSLHSIRLTIEHPGTGEYLVQGMRRKDRDILHNEDVEGMKHILRIWASEKARILGLGDGVP